VSAADPDGTAHQGGLDAAPLPTYDEQVRAALHEIEAEFLGGAPGRRT
jgi:hypothetical protein